MYNWQKVNTFVPMKEVKHFRERAESHGVCSEYAKLWDDCQSKKQVVDLALRSGCTPYVCKSIAEDWGVSPTYIADKFRAFVNDRYISQQDGYDAKMYCCHNSDMVADTTNNVIIDCQGNIDVPQGNVCEIHIVDSSCYIDSEGKGVCVVVKYGNCNITFGDNIKYHVKNGV